MPTFALQFSPLGSPRRARIFIPGRPSRMRWNSSGAVTQRRRISRPADVGRITSLVLSRANSSIAAVPAKSGNDHQNGCRTRLRWPVGMKRKRRSTVPPNEGTTPTKCEETQIQATFCESHRISLNYLKIEDCEHFSKPPWAIPKLDVVGSNPIARFFK